MKAVQLLINSYLPENLRDYSRVYDVKEFNRLLSRVANEYPEQFASILKKMSDTGRKASWRQGETITLQDLRPVIDKQAIFELMDAEIAALPKDKNFTQKRRDLFQKYNTYIEKETAKNALANRNNIAMAVLSGARGKNPQLKAMISTPGTYSDYKGRPIDVFSRESFAEGIRPTTFLASTYGSRASVVSTKCLEYQTLVRMSDGSEKRICDIQVGDEVLGADKGGNIRPVKVLNVFDQGTQGCFKYTWVSKDSDNKVCVICTPNHKFLRHSGDVLPVNVRKYGEELRRYVTAAGLIVEQNIEAASVGKAHCYDIEVDHPDHLFVLANGLITSNSSTAKGGDWSKQMSSVAADLVIRKPDCGSTNGIALSLDDASIKGRCLARDTAGIPAGTFIDKNVLRQLEKAGKKNVVVRSAITCNVPNGLCAHCVGKFYNGGKLPKIGDAVGLTASSTSGEPVTQLALNAKHTAGMSSSKRSYAGLEYLQQFTQSPEAFKDRAAVAEKDGIVESVEEAPQGGLYVVVDGEKHYVPAGHEAIVKEGDTVEAGDQLSEGLMDAEDVVRLKGIGEGRRYYAERLNQLLADSGAATDKRNTEVLARAAIRHVRINDIEGLGDYLPDDVADYNAVQTSYKLPETARLMRAKEAIGKYLQAPVMHYSIGTRITPNVAKTLQENEYTDVYADDKQPQFEPEMVRLRTASHTTKDWLASMGTSYLGKQLNESATQGDDTNILENDDFRPRLAVGVGFGSNVRETGKF